MHILHYREEYVHIHCALVYATETRMSVCKRANEVYQRMSMLVYAKETCIVGKRDILLAQKPTSLVHISVCQRDMHDWEKRPASLAKKPTSLVHISLCKRDLYHWEKRPILSAKNPTSLVHISVCKRDLYHWEKRLVLLAKKPT